MTIPEEIEQLKIKLDATADERGQAELLMEICKKSASLYDTANQVYIDRLLQLADTLQEPKYKASCLMQFAMLKYHSAEYEAALDLNRQALDLFEQLNDKVNIADVYSNMGITNQMLGNYTEALKHYFSSLKIKEEIGDRPGLAKPYANIGLVYNSLGKYPEALKYLFYALKIKEEAGDKNGISMCYNNIGSVYFNLRNYTESLKYHFDSLKIKEELGERSGIADSHGNIGNVHLELGRFTEALEEYFTCLKIKQEIYDKYGVATVFFTIGTTYSVLRQYPDALKYLQDAMDLDEEIGNKQGSKEVAFELHDIYQAMGEYENALLYHKKYHALNEEINGAEVHQKIASLQFRKDLEMKEKELEFEKREKELTQNLLLNILPAEVAAELKEKGNSEPRHFDEVTVMFTDFQNFSAFSEKRSAKDLVGELNTCFSAFDAIISRYSIEKIKTMGDGFIAASGLPTPNAGHAADMVRAAIEVRDFMTERKDQMGDQTLDVRIGLHSGRVVAGIVGVKKFAYDIWGDTVNIAARMEQNSEAGRINISQTTYELVKDKFSCQYRGEIEAKNKGKMKMYFVE